jgi:thioredoxin 1
MVKESTDQSFQDEVLNSDKPVLVDFWAEWCGPCKQIAPIIEDLANDKGDAIEVYKHNIDTNPETPGKHGVRGIPTLILFEKGKPVSTKVGALPKSALYDWIEENIG